MSAAQQINEDELWEKPFATPMVESCFGFIRGVIEGGHPSAVIYAPTGTGKSSLIRMMLIELKSFSGFRGQIFESTVISFGTPERFVTSEGAVWGWMLREIGHPKATARVGPLTRRFIVYEYMKDLAFRTPSHRMVILIDEAQKLDLEELGLVADLINELAREQLRLVVFLVGTYHLSHWKADLSNNRYSHVRRRFFTKEHGFKGVLSQEVCRRCLRRYDVDRIPLIGNGTIAGFYQPGWFREGGRLEAYARQFYSAFCRSVGKSGQINIPMAFFSLALKKLLRRENFSLDEVALDEAVEESGFAFNYEPEPSE